jgi:putative ABC transport system permease protein
MRWCAECSGIDGGFPVPQFLRNLKFALRHLAKSPGFTAVAVIIMALGIGANTAIFSVVHAVLLEPLPFSQPDRLVRLWHVPPQSAFPGVTKFSISAANFLDWQKQNTVFEGMTLYSFGAYDITGKGKPQSIRAGKITANFFPVLGVQPLYGRVFTAEEDQPGKNHELILSYKFWHSRFGSDPNVSGRTITLDGTPYVIVGVMGPKIAIPEWAEIWVPMGMTAQEAAVRGEHHFLSIARLKPGVSVKQAQAEMNTISERLAQAYPADDKGWGAWVGLLRDDMVGDVRPALLMMLGAVAFVLLIACANVANLLFARTVARRKEIAIRSALGANRARVVLPLLLEAVLISLAGGAVGLITAHYGIELLLKYFADKLPRMGTIGLSGTVLLFTLGLSLMTGLLAGLLPALNMTRGDVIHALKQGLGRTDADTGSSSTRSLLVVIEVALSLVLLIGAGLMVRSLWNLQNENPGFDAHNVLTASVEIPRTQFTKPEQESQFFSEVLARVRALPGVVSAGAVDSLPLEGGSNQPVAVEGKPVVPMSEQPEVSVRVVEPGYFQSMRIPVLNGRDIADSDAANAPAVVVVSKALARQFWGDESPIGKHLTLTFAPDKVRTVVGVVGDVHQDGLDNTDGIPSLYWPQAQVGNSAMRAWEAFGMSLVVRTSIAPQKLAPALTAAVSQVNSNIPVDEVMPLDEFVDSTLTQHSFNMQLLTIFGALALVLCAVGIYSVLAYSVKRRMREIGLRMAFGAKTRDVASLMIVQGLKPTFIGIAIGLAAAFALGRVVSSIIYGVSVRDFATFAIVTLLLIVVSLAASIIPALRATRVDPLAVLRED